MDLLTYLHVIIESGLAMVMMLAAMHINLFDRGPRGVPKIMTCVLLIDALVNIADALSYFFDGEPGRAAAIMARAGEFVMFAGSFLLMAFAEMLLEQLLKKRKGSEDKRLTNSINAVVACAVILLTISLPFGFLYDFDEQNFFYEGKAFALIPLLLVTVIVLLIVRTAKVKNALSKGEYRACMCFYILPLIGALVELLYNDISFFVMAGSAATLIMLAVLVRESSAGISVKRSFILSAEGIENISADIDRFLVATGTERQNRIRIRFTIEDALYRIWQRFGDLNMVKVTGSIIFRKPSIKIEHEGESFNPFSKTMSASEDWSSGLLASAGLSPMYSYAHGYNVIRIGLSRMRVNPVITIMISISFGLIVGTVAHVALSQSDAQFVSEGLLVPVYDLWNNMLYCVSAPAMLIIVMSTMLDTREVSEQGGNTGAITGRYFAISLIVGLLTFAVGNAVSYDSYRFDPMTRNTLAELVRKFFSIVPQNILDPIKDFNTAQLILMGIVFAYAIMSAGQRANGISSLISELNMISTQIAQWIANMMPVFTVFLTAQLVLQKNAGLLLMLLQVIPFATAVSLVTMMIALLTVSRRKAVDATVLLKKILPTFIETLKTGQVADTYAMAEKCCRKELGIQKIFTERVMPLGLVLYMPASIIGMSAFVVFAAFKSNVVITPVWMITAIVFALILTVAAPPIPGVNILSYVVIIGQLGIGKEFVLVAVLFDVVYNVFASAANQMMLQLDLILQADHVGLLRHSVLCRESAEK